MHFLQLVPPLEVDPFVGLQVLIVLEEMGDALQVDLGAVGVGLHALPQADDPAEGTARILASGPASSRMRSTPTGRAGSTAPGSTGIRPIAMTSTGSPSSASVCGMKP